MVIPDIVRHRPAPPLTRGRLEWVLGTRPNAGVRDGGAGREYRPRSPRPAARYFEYNSTTNCSCAAIGMFGRVGRSSIRPLNDSRSTASQESGAPREAWSIDAWTATISRDFMRTRISWPG